MLVQAGVIGSQPASSDDGNRAGAAASVRTASSADDVHRRVVLPAAQTPSLDATLGELNGLLAESARTKGDLGKLIGDVQTGTVRDRPRHSRREIDAIVSQREQLHAELADFPAPAALSKALALLRDSITASLADDRLVRQWIVAHYDGDVAADALWQAQGEASRAASEAKRAFRTEYADRLRASGLSGSIPDY